jgi:molybdate transport system substrate-binding protein
VSVSQPSDTGPVGSLPRARGRAGVGATVLVAGFALIAALTMALAGRSAEAAEIRVFTANGVKLIMADLVPRFESATGDKLIVTHAGPGELRRRILDGAGFDVAFLPAETLRSLATLGKVVAGSMVDIANSDIGLAIREGADKPDTSSAEAFKRSLLAAATIAITDPASGGVTSAYFLDVLKRLGIADAMESKLRLTKDISNSELVGRGEAEMAVELAHEIRSVAGVEFVPFPPEFQRGIVFAAGIAAGAPASEEAQAAAKALIAFLSGPAAAPMIVAAGLEPVK